MPEETEPRFDLIPEYDIPAPNAKNRTWLMPDGSSKKVGGQFKDGKKVEPVFDVDIQ